MRLSMLRGALHSLTAVKIKKSKDVVKFKVGQVLELEATPRTLARLESNNQVLFWCQIGQLDGSYAMPVADPIDQKREFVDDILSR